MTYVAADAAAAERKFRTNHMYNIQYPDVAFKLKKLQTTNFI